MSAMRASCLLSLKLIIACHITISCICMHRIGCRSIVPHLRTLSCSRATWPHPAPSIINSGCNRSNRVQPTAHAAVMRVNY
ncbi:hypothetical protein BGW36DRAFT_57874 [Talaromyces proteolyticus]|uniref:Secreted protein n=1 Tax=Talaromyces proteolyticus TaxID=1131652 RepID=A0AAD4PUV5_9EURO|nr:uncharacterized protein BGW36DRAFT_57874 [Talaromyces proteolyticus]KAH8690594.1 hypothetical protein BGW36DRAFT_57874 [Talaromyces proteolyticus]